MPKPQAAVPFVNQKGQRSMKRVKVERYRPGKVPAYAAGAQDDDEYYTTDDEDEDDIDEDLEQDEEEDYRDRRPMQIFNDAHNDKLSSNKRDEINKQDKNDKNVISDSSSDNYDDDPRMRKLKLISKKSNITRAKHKAAVKQHHSSEDETEEQIKLRHQLARNRIQDPPIGLKAIFPEFNDAQSMVFVKHEDDNNDSSDQDDDDDEYQHLIRDQKQRQSRMIDTDDIMGDFMPTGLRPEDMKRKEDDEVQKSFLDMLEEAKDEAILRSNLERHVEEDIRLETLREARAKGDFSASNQANAINTDDDVSDDESAGVEYEAWKKREIVRILRYESELATLMQSVKLRY